MPLGIVVGDGNTGVEAVANKAPGTPDGREPDIARVLTGIRERGVRNTAWLTADVHHTAGNRYTPERAGIGADPFWEARLQFAEDDAIERGGRVEVFESAQLAQARADHIEAVTRSMPALTEHGYVQGPILVRVTGSRHSRSSGPGAARTPSAGSLPAGTESRGLGSPRGRPARPTSSSPDESG